MRRGLWGMRRARRRKGWGVEGDAAVECGFERVNIDVAG